MTDDEQAMTNAVILALEPYRDVVARMVTLVERLMDRVEVLELERLHGRSIGSSGPSTE
jgi:hypothetical protein